MIAYRLASEKYPPDNSEGARRIGGRWNRVGTAVIYASSNLLLAQLEVIVHFGFIPIDYRVVEIDIPNDLMVETVQLADLPKGWPDVLQTDTMDFGTNWAASLRTAVLRVPSAVHPPDYNYILNPSHPDFVSIHFHVPERRIDPLLQR